MNQATQAADEHGQDLQLLAAKGLEMVRSVSYEILDLIASGNLKNETVRIGSLTREKTNADRISNDLLFEKLGVEFPAMLMVSEATQLAGLAGPERVLPGCPYALVDPIDGTVHLQNGDGEWLINLCFCVGGLPLVGICAVPEKDKIFLGVRGQSSREFSLDTTTQRTLMLPENQTRRSFGIASLLDLGGNHEHRERWYTLAEQNAATEVHEFGTAYSYLKVADGSLDAFVNLCGNFHWDTSAQQVILEGAGCRLVPIDWASGASEIDTSELCRYPLTFLKDEGHVAARAGLGIRVDRNLRISWTPALG